MSTPVIVHERTPERWPDIHNAPHSPLRASVAHRLLERIAQSTPVAVSLPDGRLLHDADPHWPLLQIRDEHFFHRLGCDLKIGLGEAYMAGDWKAGAGSDLADVLTPYAARLTRIVPGWMRSFRRLIEPRHPASEENHRKGARSNISRHYDLSNDLFATFLDETMTYSSALFDRQTGEPTFEDLPAAQRRKIDRILDLANVREGTRVLEIGTGWGELALRAAARGAHVHSVTLSHEQQALAQARIEAAGLSHLVDIELRDYRDVTGTYDAVVSVEMIEAVGERYWPTYFASVGSLLAPGGRFALQSITMSHARMRASRHAFTWIHKYIFPGGIIPSPEVIRNEAGLMGNMRVVDELSFGIDYARTLRLWRERFMERSAHVEALGFDGTFRRMWEFYLAYSEAGFRSGHLDVRHFALEKQA